MAEISFDEFQKVEMKVGKIIEATEVPNSKKLLKLIVDFGDEKRQSVAGIRPNYTPDQLIGRKYVFVVNLQKKVMMGIESQCMILAAEDAEGNVVLVAPEREIREGSRVR
ncbi:MAG: methionine--tRNA ligase subunit beta [Candidatus Nanoarchaeia archaeon]|nr:methionine--tRNA ligase subunit beta [Candidatus Haiyanarchaeum thermophilum]MCW1303138.1 methionine--tRNA ligase subunit beta [Candidatus Haiyanarchaeum thermophilum]MCW1303803.1 methionine--tRNA ligase subunit beta [Candidatus Haiyanarchaeum thermophilum]MCW1306581.1 methionine--tRNA ligase subunit beta [Candidatus Haiyanarchaeum thermophilum]MCW1306994.1 methionine--tRNA ligase subunit beta [Candidatus Haiyanarchaeum thermophilum]